MSQTNDDEAVEFNSKQVEQGRLQAILSYIVPFFLILPLRKRDNRFAIFHARQALTLWVIALGAALALSMGLVFLTVLLHAMPISVTVGLLAFVVFATAFAVSFIGARNAWNGKGRVLPYVGRFGESHMIHLVKD